MRTELETQLLFCAPRELLLVGQLSGRTRKLLDAYAVPASGVRSEPVDRWVCCTIRLLGSGHRVGCPTSLIDNLNRACRTHGAGGAQAVLESFFQESGWNPGRCYCCHSLPYCVI